MFGWWWAVRTDLSSPGYLYSINVERVRRVSIQAGPVGSVASSAVVEVKRAFNGVNSPSVSFASTQTIDLDGSSILEIDVTDTAWLHIVCTTAESGKSVQIETETSGVMQGTVMWQSVDLDTVGVKSLANTSTAYKAFMLVDPQQTNSTATLEVKRRVDRGLEAISFASPASLTFDSATITEIDADGSGELVAVCGAVQAGQVAMLWWYLRGEVAGDSERGTSFASPPYAGQRFARTDLGNETFTYDAVRGKWLGELITWRVGRDITNSSGFWLSDVGRITMGTSLGRYFKHDHTIVKVDAISGQSLTGDIRLYNGASNLGVVASWSASTHLYADDVDFDIPGSDSAIYRPEIQNISSGTADDPLITLHIRRDATGL